MIKVSEKKDFIKWFLRNYQLKRRESVWMLNYLISHDALLENIHFVDSIEGCPRGVIMSTYCVDTIPFRFHKGGVTTTDAEKAFHDIRLNRNEKFYIQLEFRGAMSKPPYVAVLEENPFSPKIKTVNTHDSNLAEKILTQSILGVQLEKLEKQINEALDNKDKDLFMQLSKQYAELKKK